MIEGPDYIRISIPDPGEQMLDRFLNSDLIHSTTAIQQFSEAGILTPINRIENFISVSLVHA
jgi:hypothetical protein